MNPTTHHKCPICGAVTNKLVRHTCETFGETFFPMPALNRTQRAPIGPVRRHSKNGRDLRGILADLGDTATRRLLEERDTVSRRYQHHS